MFDRWRRQIVEEVSAGVQTAEPEFAERRYSRFFLKRIFQTLVQSAFGLLLAALGLSGLIQAALLWAFRVLQENPLLAVLVYAGVFSASFVALAFLRGPRPDYPVVESSYDVEALTISMRYVSRDKAVYSRRFRIRVRSSFLDSFEDSFGWTGKGVETLESSDPFHSVAITDTKGFYTVYRVAFNRRYARGSVIDFTVTWTLDATSAHPFVGRVIEKPYGELTFLVEIYEGGFAPTAMTTIALSAQDKAGAKHGDIPFTRGGAVAWVIKKPTLGRYYELRWTGPDWK